MKLNDYQKRAMETCLPSCDNFTYMAFGLIAEVGEIADKVAKMKRKKEAYLSDDHIVSTSCDEVVAREMCHELIKEVGDVMWFCAGLAHYLGYSLEEVAQINLDKLSTRKQSNTIIDHNDH